MRQPLARLLDSEDGGTTAEYGFLIVLCTGAALAALLLLDQSVQTLSAKARERMGSVDAPAASAPSSSAPTAPAPGDQARGRGRGQSGNSAGGAPPTP